MLLMCNPDDQCDDSEKPEKRQAIRQHKALHYGLHQLLCWQALEVTLDTWK